MSYVTPADFTRKMIDTGEAKVSPAPRREPATRALTASIAAE